MKIIHLYKEFIFFLVTGTKLEDDIDLTPEERKQKEQREETVLRIHFLFKVPFFYVYCYYCYLFIYLLLILLLFYFIIIIILFIYTLLRLLSIPVAALIQKQESSSFIPGIKGCSRHKRQI